MTQSVFIDVQDICIGMYVQLDMGWLKHPFPVSSFRINSQEQIAILQSLDVAKIRCLVAKSDAQVVDLVHRESAFIQPVPSSSSELSESVTVEQSAGLAETAAESIVGKLENLAADATDIKLWQTCEQRFTSAAREYREVVRQVGEHPEDAHKISFGLVAGYIAELLDAPHTTIRLLSENAGAQQGAHPISVAVLSLLLGKSYGFHAARLTDLGLAALLHDVGKADLDPRCVELLPDLTEEQKDIYEEHVGASVAHAVRMGLSPAVLTAIAQHHEAVDGSGFPLHLLKEDLSVEGQIVALANCYDKLCNPAAHALALTPHEALAALFSQRRGGCSRELVDLLVRVLGIYPPGSVVQLSDDRYALVLSVDSWQPLKPTVLIYDPMIARRDATPVDMSTLSGVLIKRSLRPAQLPREALDYLSPRERVRYFFERALPLMSVGVEK